MLRNETAEIFKGKKTKEKPCEFRYSMTITISPLVA